MQRKLESILSCPYFFCYLEFLLCLYLLNSNVKNVELDFDIMSKRKDETISKLEHSYYENNDFKENERLKADKERLEKEFKQSLLQISKF